MEVVLGIKFKFSISLIYQSASLGQVLNKHSHLLCLDSKFNLSIHPSVYKPRVLPCIVSSISEFTFRVLFQLRSSISVFHYSSYISVKCDLEVIHVHKWNKS